MLIAFAPNTRLHDETSPSRPDATAQGPRETRSPTRARRTSERVFGKLAAVGWLGLVAYYLLYAEPAGAGRVGPELTALLVLGGWAFILAAAAHHANGRIERLRLEERSRILLGLLERSPSQPAARTHVPDEGGPSVH